jgi:hypothetical protein
MGTGAACPVWRAAKDEKNIITGRLSRLPRTLTTMVARCRKIQTPNEKNFIFRDGTVALWRAMGI